MTTDKEQINKKVEKIRKKSIIKEWKKEIGIPKRQYKYETVITFTS
jgi:hypothetical protein